MTKPKSSLLRIVVRSHGFFLRLFWRLFLLHCGSWESTHRCRAMAAKRKCGKEASNFRHGGYVGGYPSPELRAYMAMISRCYNPNSDHWAWYGARGVTVDSRWLGKNGFKHFCKDMGRKALPLKQYTLGRILDCPVYNPKTCEWQTWAQQGAEKRGANAAARLHYHHLFPAEGNRLLE